MKYDGFVSCIIKQYINNNMQTIKSEFLKFTANDFVKALFIAVATPVAAVVGQALTVYSQGQPFVIDLPSLGHIALAAGVGYLIKQFFTNSNGQLFKGEPKKVDTIPPPAPTA